MADRPVLRIKGDISKLRTLKRRPVKHPKRTWDLHDHTAIVQISRTRRSNWR